MRFLVGYFYFSGIREIMQALRETRETLSLKILVGMETEERIVKGQRLAPEFREDGRQKKSEAVDKFLSSWNNVISSDDSDSKEFGEDALFYLQMLAEDKITIRKTREPNHSKLYLFALNEEQSQDSYLLTGSSNLTQNGLSINQEFNIGTNDNYAYQEAKKYFDDLWNSSVEITETPEIKKEVIRILKEHNPGVSQDPFTSFIAVLRHYADGYDVSGIEDKTGALPEGYEDFEYQRDAVL